jgi:drug/metabolite transporter (DMT)-like permease
VLTALFSIPLLGEHLSVEQIIGGALVLGGIWVVNRRAGGQ